MQKFDSFCTRMWVDYCDENDDRLTASTTLDLDQYKSKYKDRLFDKFVKQKGVVNGRNV